MTSADQAATSTVPGDLGGVPGLARTWATGWAGVRGYPMREEGADLVVDVGRPGRRVERILLAPDAQQLDAGLGWLAGQSDCWLTSVVPAASPVAVPAGVEVFSDHEALMWTWLTDPERDAGPLPVAQRSGDRLWVALSDGAEVMASGQVGLVGRVAVFDEIVTDPAYRRRGLASTVMAALTRAALEAGSTRGALVASPEGQLLYRRLGWTHAGSVLIHRSRTADASNEGIKAS